jgi:pimeloyl-ACP methyl ester carboxylesterase
LRGGTWARSDCSDESQLTNFTRHGSCTYTRLLAPPPKTATYGSESAPHRHRYPVIERQQCVSIHFAEIAIVHALNEAGCEFASPATLARKSERSSTVNAQRSSPEGRHADQKDADTFFGVELPALTQWTFDARSAAAISQPALSVVGTETQPLWKEIAELLRSSLPHVEECRIEGVGHLLQVQRPEPVARGIARVFGTPRHERT